MTRHIVIATTLLVVALAPSAAWPADIEGKIQSVDAGEVKVSYEEKDGKAVATSVEVK
jgi:hypothetical protein